VSKSAIDSNKELLNVLNFLAPGEVKKHAALASALVADESPSLDEMPSDEDMAKQFGDGSEGGDESGDAGVLPEGEETVEEAPAEDGDEDGEESTTVGPYDLTFHLRKIITAFDQVVREAEQLRKLTEGITANMTSEQQASWIEQRRFFIETAKEAEGKWSEFKTVLLNFSLTPKL